MKLKDFKQHISNFEEGTEFKFGISEPFSWRGSYDEVAFSLIEESFMGREEILRRIELAYTETFYGHKGGEYTYNDYTSVNFEEGRGSWSDNGYTNNMIEKISGSDSYKDNDERLIKLAFSK